jgi:rod shape-determining protein MreC
MRDLLRFLLRQRNNLLFALLMGLSLSLLVKGNMHQRAQAISSSRAVIGRIYGMRSGITEFAGLRQVNADLNRALAEERSRAYAMPGGADTAGTVRDSVRGLRYAFVPARVINSTTHKEKNYITLDKGGADGVRPDMGVVGADGIVGVVRDTSAHFALVTSVLNPDHAASAQLKGSRHFGQLRWNTGDPRTVALSDIDKHVTVRVGDTVVTRGSEGVYPPGFAIGVVEAVENDPSIPFHVIAVRLSEDLTRSAQVQVVSDLLRAERDSLQAKAPVE